VAEQVDLERIQAVARQAPVLPPVPARSVTFAPAPLSGREEAVIRIGIARDAAFAFYYPGDLAALQANGAELIPFDTLRDAQLPDVDALFIGGGFPEVHMQSLEANTSLRESIRQAVEAGMPVYAECGGLMYLSRSLSWQGQRCVMVGALPADTVMHAKPQGRGYVRLRETANYPWPHTSGASPDADVRAHEFHYSSLENLPPDLHYAYTVVRGAGIDGRNDGIVYKNVLACYAHMRDLSGNHWTRRFVEFIRQHRNRRNNAHNRVPSGVFPHDKTRVNH
jgi:cobyrinic acid a,c-diamide synthase